MPDPAPVAGVVLAAGSSTRMGRNKLLLDFGGETLVRRVAATAVAGGLTPVIVVVGFEGVLVIKALTGLAVRVVTNPAFSAGVNGSVRRGLAAVPPQNHAAVVLLGDMPFVTADMIAALVDRHRRSAAPLVVSSYGGVQAPPTLYARHLFGEFTATWGDGAGRRVVERHRAEGAVLEWPAGRLADIDYPSDYPSPAVRFGPGGRG